MERSPEFLRQFSKQESQAERDALASQIKEVRKQRDLAKKESLEPMVNLSEQERQIAEEEGKKIEGLKILGDEIDHISSDIALIGIEEEFQMSKLRADIAIGATDFESLGAQRKVSRAEHEIPEPKDASQEAKTKTQEMLKKFYEGEQKKWAQGEYSQSEIEKYLTEEHMASLSLEDYVALLQRFPSEMVTHVTRQGVRENSTFIYHDKGIGEFHNGFEKVLDQGKLLSAMGIVLQEKGKEAAVEKYLNLSNCKTKEEALKNLKVFLHGRDPVGSYADTNAVHFASESVADAYYGGESGNEIFFVFPSAMVANEYDYGGGGDLAAKNYSYSNDQWVYLKDHEGMDINAGLVFISKDAQVNPETGSQFEIDQEGKPVESDIAQEVNKILKSEHFFTVIMAPLLRQEERPTAAEKQYNLDISLKNMETLGFKIDDADKNVVKKVLENILRTAKDMSFEFDSKFATTSRAELDATMKLYQKNLDDRAKDVLRGSGAYYKRTEKKVNASDYWENYFKNNPEKRPSKVVYYEGKNPTNALHNWREVNGLNKNITNPDEYKQKSIGFQDEGATSGLGEFETLALSIIDGYFEEQEASAAV